MFDEKEANEMRIRADKLLTRKCRGGKNAFAAISDAVILTVIMGFVLYVTVRPCFANRTAALAATLFCLILAAAVTKVCSNALLENKKAKAHEEFKEKLAILRLMTDKNSMFRYLPDDEHFYYIEAIGRFGANEVLKAYNSCGRKVQTVSFGTPDEEAKNTMALLGMAETKTPMEILGKRASEMVEVTEEETGRAIIDALGRTKRMRPRELIKLVCERAFKFMALGGALFALSYVSGCAIWYRAAATACFGIGSAVMALEAINKARKA